MPDITPCEHLGICTKLQNDIDNSLQKEPDYNDFLLDVNYDEANVISLALMLYKSFLINKYRDKMRQEIEEGIN